MIVLYILLTIIVTFLFIIVLRALMFNPKTDSATIIQGETIDKDKCIDALSKLIRCKTISNHDSSLEDNAEFDKLLNMLPKLYPSVFKTCEIYEFAGRGILIKWAGKNSDKPTVLMAHYDVVPVTEENWEKPPFDAVIENDVMWGRGTLDTKATFNGILFSANHLIESGFTPDNDIYLAFSGSEEINGDGAKNIVKYFSDNNITPALVVDEGGAVVENVFPGVKSPCALVGIAEKGLLNIEYKMYSAGGHASAPIPNSPIVSLARACDRIEKNPMKLRLTKPAADMFDTLGRHSSFVYKIIFSNLWCFKWVLDIICRKSGGEMNALLRTTVAFTMANGSNGRNVIPPEATLISNIRINPDDTCVSVIRHLKKTVSNDNIQITMLEGNEPSRISKTDCDEWNKVKNAIASTWDNTIISPYLMVQCSDSRHYGVISDRVYRFSAMALSSDERKTIHGNNERIKLESITKVVDFYIKLIKQC